MKIAIIEDESLTARDLAKTITSIDPDAEIVAILSSVEEGISFFKKSPAPDLIFSDIQLGDGLSFVIFKEMNCCIPIIFCTAYDEYAIQAFKTAGIDYLLKPFSRLSVSKALEKFQTLKAAFEPPPNDFGTVLKTMMQHLQNGPMPSVIIHQGEKIIPLEGEKIALFSIEGDYTFAHTFDGDNFMLSQKLDALEKTFGGSFFRANRQHLVNRKAVKDAEHFAHRKIALNLSIPFNETVLVGKLKASAFWNGWPVVRELNEAATTPRSNKSSFLNTFLSTPDIVALQQPINRANFALYNAPSYASEISAVPLLCIAILFRISICSNQIHHQRYDSRP